MTTTQMRPELQTFAEAQEAVLRSHDPVRGRDSWKDMTAQTIASRLCEEVGEIFTEMFGQDNVCDFLIASLQDHVEECAIDLDYDPAQVRREAADVGNFCMFLHEIAESLATKRGEEAIEGSN